MQSTECYKELLLGTATLQILQRSPQPRFP